MKITHLKDMHKGWFVGNFEPSVLKTDHAEVAVKTYKAGDNEETHHHRVATEITVIVSGDVKMNGKRYGEGDIITIPPKEATDFHAITDAVTAVVKVPCVAGDKYPGHFND